MTPPAHDPPIHHLPESHMRRWDNYYNFNVLQDDLNTLGKLKISCFSVKALTFWGNAAPELLTVHVPAPSITPQGSINHVTALSPSPGGKSLPPAFCIPLLWIKKPNQLCCFSCSLEIRQGTTSPMAVLEPQKGQRMEKRTLAERVGSRWMLQYAWTCQWSEWCVSNTVLSIEILLKLPPELMWSLKIWKYLLWLIEWLIDLIIYILYVCVRAWFSCPNIVSQSQVRCYRVSSPTPALASEECSSSLGSVSLCQHRGMSQIYKGISDGTRLLCVGSWIPPSESLRLPEIMFSRFFSAVTGTRTLP